MLSADTRDIEIYYVAEDSDSKSIFNDDVKITSSDKGPKIREEWLREVTSDVLGIQNYCLTNGTTATASFNKKKAKNASIIGASKTYLDAKKYKVVAGRNFYLGDHEHFLRIIMFDTKLTVKLFGTSDSALNK